MKNGDMPAHAQPDTYHPNGQVEYGSGGLTKREYFAGLAMQGMLASDVEGVLDPGNCAQCSVAYADALLAELGK